MNRTEAENYIYKSYLRAQKFLKYGDLDADKRHPQYTRALLTDMSRTPCAVITGSKGKGSVANMAAAILQTELNVGLMTSPHISNFCERFKINGVDIDDTRFAECITALQPQFDAIDQALPPHHFISPMGIQAALALTHFNNNATQYNIFECGKGAQYDDVNNLPHERAIINTIFLEHTRELGKTVAEIAHDKAHVITGNEKCVYVGVQPVEAMAVIKHRADRLGVTLKRYGHEFAARNIRYTRRGMVFDVMVGSVTFSDLSVPLLGEHQAKNCALALAMCLDILPTVNETKVRDALSHLCWPGRMEIISSSPFTLLDACINRESALNVVNTLHFLQIHHFAAIIGIPDDKDFGGVAKVMHQCNAEIIMTKSENPHYIFSKSQIKALEHKGITGAMWADDITKAYALARAKSRNIVILGTTSLISAAKSHLTVSPPH